MLVYLSSNPKNKPMEIQVGERGKRSAAKIMRVEKNKIITEDQVWQDGDALCCPSGSGQSVYEIKNGQLIKTKENGG
jgi:hypothetical protein